MGSGGYKITVVPFTRKLHNSIYQYSVIKDVSARLLMRFTAEFFSL